MSTDYSQKYRKYKSKYLGLREMAGGNGLDALSASQDPDSPTHMIRPTSPVEHCEKLFLGMAIGDPIYDYSGEVLFITGPPGIGKSTLGQALAQAKGLIYFSTGDSYRWHRTNNTREYRLLDHIKRNYPNKDFKACLNVLFTSAIMELIGESGDSRGIVIDGFEGNGDFTEFVEYFPNANVKVINLQVPRAERGNQDYLVNRIVNRDREGETVRKARHRVGNWFRMAMPAINEEIRSLGLRRIEFEGSPPVQEVLHRLTRLDQHGGINLDDLSRSPDPDSPTHMIRSTSPVGHCEKLFLGMAIDDPVYDYNKHVLFVMGPPGSGKSTLGQQLAERLGFDYVSTGDVYRHHEERGSRESQLLKRVGRDNFKPCLNVLFISAIMDRIGDSNYSKGIVIDGFGGDGDFTEFVKYFPNANAKVINLVVPDFDYLLKRVLERGRKGEGIGKAKSRIQNYFKFYLPAALREIERLRIPRVNFHGDQTVDQVLQHPAFADLQ